MDLGFSPQEVGAGIAAFLILCKGILNELSKRSSPPQGCQYDHKQMQLLLKEVTASREMQERDHELLSWVKTYLEVRDK